MKIDVAYIISHGFAARMVMQTNLLGRLVEQGLKIALISPDKEDINLKEYCDEHNILLCQFNPQASFWNSNYSKARMYFLENINKNPALYEKYIYEKKRVKEGTFLNKLKINIFKASHDLKEIFPIIKRIFKKREAKMLESQLATDFLKTLNPTILVTTYPVNYSESMLVYSAQRKGIKTIMHLLSWDNISCKGHFPILADEYIAWGPIMRNELKEYYNVEESKIHITGVPHFDLHAVSMKTQRHGKYLEDLGLDPEKPYLFFGMSSPRFAPKEIDIVERLSAQIESNTYGRDMQMVVRPHPQNIQGNMSDTSWLPRIRNLKSKRVGVDFPNLADSKMAWSMEKEDMYKLSSLIAGAALCLNSGSTLSIDSMMCGTPVILTSFDGGDTLSYWMSARRLVDYNHLKKLIALEGVVSCDSYASLQSAINEITHDRDAISETISKSVQQFCPISGDATEKVVQVLTEILKVKTNNVNA
jgi:hypothetical protein